MEPSTTFLLFWSFTWMVIASVLYSANKELARRLAIQEKRLAILYAEYSEYINLEIKKFIAGLKL